MVFSDLRGGTTPVYETFGYDASGNRTSRAAGGETVTYTWDALNQLTGVAYATAGDAVAYRYDALGRRIERAHTVVGQGTTTDRWVYVDQNVVQQDRDGAVWQEYVHQGGLDNPLALVDHSGGAAAAYYYHRDGLGSVRALTDATQAVAQSYTYTSYGVTTVANPSGVDQPFQYTAREWDAPSGLYYYRARYYDPAAGRFLSHDPIRHDGGYNLYAYVGGNPLNAVDPFGTDELLGKCQNICDKRHQKRLRKCHLQFLRTGSWIEWAICNAKSRKQHEACLAACDCLFLPSA